LTLPQLQQTIEGLRAGIIGDIKAALAADTPALRHRTLILWDMQNVPLRPGTTIKQAADDISNLVKVSHELSGAPDDSDYDIVAAFNPHSSPEGWGYVSRHVIVAVNAHRGDLLAAGTKAGAADGILMRKLAMWLDSTKHLGSARSVVFVTGDGDFAAYINDAKTAGCSISLLYRDSASVNYVLLSMFPKDKLRAWDAVLGEKGLAELTNFQATITARQAKSREEQESAVNKRPDLLKTELCAFIAAGVPCKWSHPKTGCWFAHSDEELRPPIRY
jgi:hypothetical protein